MIPQPVTDVDLAFGGDITKLLPRMEDIPVDYPFRATWENIITTWFFHGIKTAVFVPKPGVNKSAALRHIAAIMASFEPKHEHKEAGCAYLCSLWFEKPNL